MGIANMNFKVAARLAGIIALTITQGCSHRDCNVKTLSQIVSPNGEQTAMIEESSCGSFSVADSSMSDSVRLVSSKKIQGDEKSNVDNVVFSMDAENYDKNGIVLQWLSNNQVEISVAKGAIVGTWLTRLNGTDIEVKLRERSK